MRATEGISLPLAYSDPYGGRGDNQSDAQERVPVLFVHGFGHQRSVWEESIARLPDRYRPVSVDLRGHGESAWSPTAEYALEDYANDLAATLDVLGIERCFVVGHSLGGNVSTLFAAAHPERVLGLVLVDTGPVLESSGVASVLGEVDDAFRSYASVEQYRDQLDRIHPLGSAEILDRMARTALVRRLDGRFELALDPGVFGVSNADSEGPEALADLEGALWSALGRIRSPTLVVRGGASAILREEVVQKMVESVLEDGRRVTLPGAGHCVMIDAAEALASELGEFLSAQSAP